MYGVPPYASPQVAALTAQPIKGSNVHVVYFPLVIHEKTTTFWQAAEDSFEKIS